MDKELQLALISGPAYDPLYQRLPVFTEATGVPVNVSFTGDHPALNRHLASLNEVPYDLVSTLFHALGIDPATEYSDTLNRPRRLVDHGAPVLGLF